MMSEAVFSTTSHTHRHTHTQTHTRTRTRTYIATGCAWVREGGAPGAAEATKRAPVSRKHAAATSNWCVQVIGHVYQFIACMWLSYCVRVGVSDLKQLLRAIDAFRYLAMCINSLLVCNNHIVCGCEWSQTAAASGAHVQVIGGLY